MKKIFLYILFISIISCKKTIFECKLSGKTNTKQINLEDFDIIEVNPLIELKIIDGNENKMQIKADKDIFEFISYNIVNNKLILKNEKYCTIENEKATAIITLTVDQISKIIANTDKKISSKNILNFNKLELISENAVVGTNNIADFDLHIQVDTLKIYANGSSIFNLKGNAKYMFVGFYGVNPSLRAKELQVEKIKFYHRSSNDMHLFPIQKIEGDLYGYGDIYIYNRPMTINIREHYKGSVYFVN